MIIKEIKIITVLMEADALSWQVLSEKLVKIINSKLLLL